MYRVGFLQTAKYRNVNPGKDIYMWQIQLYFAEHLIYGCLVTYVQLESLYRVN